MAKINEESPIKRGKSKPRFKDVKKREPKTLEGQKRPNFLIKGKNNIEWRTGDKVLTKLVATLPFGIPIGISETVPYDMSVNLAVGGTKLHVVPGILALSTKLTVGSGRSQDVYNSPINLAIRKIYSFVRHANSGSRNYEAADLGLYVVAIGQALGFLGYCQRVLAMINNYSTTNRYTPKYLINAMGLDYEDLIANQAQLKYFIAWMGRAIGALAMPKMPYFTACYEAYKWVYRDNDSPKEQFYMNIPEDFGVYNPTHSSAGGGVEFETTNPLWVKPGDNAPFTTLLAFGHKIMDVLLSDEDVGIISGDILKAYKDTGLFVPEAFGDYSPIIKDDEALQQFHNIAVVKPDLCRLTAIEQLAGGTNEAPYIKPQYTSNSSLTSPVGIAHLLYIDAFSKVPEPEEVVNCTVFNAQFQCISAGTPDTYSVSEAIYDLFMPCRVYLQVDLATRYEITNALDRTGSGIFTNLSASEQVITNFDWHPFKFMYSNSGADIVPIGDLQNARFFSTDVANRIHEASMLNLLQYSDSNFTEK